MKPELNKYALELFVGETDRLTATFPDAEGEDEGEEPVVWRSEDPEIVSAGEDGVLTGLKPGKTAVTAEKGGKSVKCDVYVVEKEFSFDDNILISVFWPPTVEYVNDKQYTLLEKAGIDWVMGAGEETLSSKEVQLKMLELCYKHGMRMNVSTPGTGWALTTKTDEEIAAIVEEFRNIPAANGFYILDEPGNPNVFINAYRAMKTTDPNSYMHLNFLPYGCYASPRVYESQMNDWAKLCAETGYPLDYLMYDLYPFGLEPGSMNRGGFLMNLECARRAGLRNGVKTANYIQSVEQCVAFRSPNRAETLYEINMSLAFGIKQISYFTWFTPHDRSEPFANGIISKDGVPSEKYKYIYELNAYVHAIGKTLIKCDAIEVYAGEEGYGAIETLPYGYFVSLRGDKDLTVSVLRDRETGRNYVMAVNNDFGNAKETELVFDKAVAGVFGYIDEKDGSLKALKVAGDGSVKLKLEAGGAVIIALPEGFDRKKDLEWTPAEGGNLALHAEISCSTSEGSGGWYMDNLNDGVRYSAENAQGWRSVGNDPQRITVSFDKAVALNRIDFYPAGGIMDYGSDCPESYRISVSNDGETWREIEFKLLRADRADDVKTAAFDRTEARFIRVVIDEISGDYVTLAEIEIYDDSGNVPEPVPLGDIKEERGLSIVSYSPGENLAKLKPVTVSSYPGGTAYRDWGWWPSFLTDLDPKKGWTSDVGLHKEPAGEEFAVIDMKDIFALEKAVLTPLGAWPADFEISVSGDMKNWTKVCSFENCPVPDGAFTADMGGAVGRYVMIKGTKLRYGGNVNDGYLMQLGEVELYGTPVVDYEEAKALMAKFLEAGGSEKSSAYSLVYTEVCGDGHLYREHGLLTQTRLDSFLRKMLKEVGLGFES
ncbi:MAG: discoidin domain-containing protein [Clostridia bacterium]|nr:discoidin domain-containing protein [Clostridia bacterium]